MLRKKFENFTERTGMINIYACGDCGKVVTYVYMADGVTPSEIRCTGCGQVAYSQFASVNQPSFYWYRPGDEAELLGIATAAYEQGKDSVYEGQERGIVIDQILQNYVLHYNGGGLFARGL